MFTKTDCFSQNNYLVSVFFLFCVFVVSVTLTFIAIDMFLQERLLEAIETLLGKKIQRELDIRYVSGIIT